MKIALIIIFAIIVIGLLAYYVFFPKNTFITIYQKDKSGITFSRTGIKFRNAPDYYPENGFEHLDWEHYQFVKFFRGFLGVDKHTYTY